MKVKMSEMTEFAAPNGVPCNGDLIESVVDGVRYRAEYYVDGNCGHPMLCLAADSPIEKFNGQEWERMKFSDDSAGNDEFNRVLNLIMPELICDE